MTGETSCEILVMAVTAARVDNYLTSHTEAPMTPSVITLALSPALHTLVVIFIKAVTHCAGSLPAAACSFTM